MPLGLQTAQLNFEAKTEIGQEGRNSKVYLAHDKQLDGELVIKEVPKSKIPHATEYYTEAKILHASSHPNVCGINYGCSDADNIYMAMPYYKNGSLKKLMGTKHLTIRETLRYSIQFLSGLNNVHSKGLIHFDIKPDNILISDSDEAILADFGLAKAMDRLGFATPDKLYPKGIPPETFTSSDKTILFDIYLCGLTLYRIVNGDSHYLGQFAFPSQPDYINAIKSGNFPDRNSYLPHVPLKLQRTINKALSVNTLDRHQSVLELINELSDIDENLDWRYENHTTNQKWTKSLPDKSLEISMFGVSPNITIKSKKTMAASGNTTSISGHSHVNLSNSNFLAKLKKAIKEL